MKLAYIVYCTRVYGKYSFFEYKKEKDVIKREQPIKKNKKRKEEEEDFLFMGVYLGAIKGIYLGGIKGIYLGAIKGIHLGGIKG